MLCWKQLTSWLTGEGVQRGAIAPFRVDSCLSKNCWKIFFFADCCPEMQYLGLKAILKKFSGKMQIYP